MDPNDQMSALVSHGSSSQASGARKAEGEMGWLDGSSAMIIGLSSALSIHKIQPKYARSKGDSRMQTATNRNQDQPP